MKDWGITPTIDDFLARERVLETLEQIVQKWVIKVAQTKLICQKTSNLLQGFLAMGHSDYRPIFRAPTSMWWSLDRSLLKKKLSFSGSCTRLLDATPIHSTSDASKLQKCH